MSRIFLKLKNRLVLALLAAVCAIPAFAAAQQNTGQISGTVVDEFGSPMAGVVVLVKGNNNGGAVTNNQGVYEIKAAPASTLSSPIWDIPIRRFGSERRRSSM